MAYNYYQNAVPGWGTSQFQFGAPPAPGFQPQPSWRGLDFYNAHAINPDSGLYDSVLGRFRDVPDWDGPGHNEARHWHRRIYGGLINLGQALPADIGAAAAYEAYRTWKYNTYLYEPLNADRERQREGLIGMAIAETTRLWQSTGRPQDTFGLRAASDTAAHTAARLADRLLGYSGMPIVPSQASSYEGDGYGYDDGYARRPRRGSFNTGIAPSVIRVGGGSPYGAGASAYTGSMGGMPIPGAGAGGMGIIRGGYGAGVPGPYPGQYGAAGSAYGVGGGIGALGSGGLLPSPYAGTAYGGGRLDVPMSSYPGGTPGYVNQAAGYGGSYGAYPGQGAQVPAGSTIIIHQQPRSSKRRHSTSNGHHHHHRSKSIEILHPGYSSSAGYGY
ncbi:hypothetical protein A0H81_12947 [Grifola frondosa]|uniref:Uncharacterized protein n=1 Tax=Grifola frondosa TaxID=5627 RepID=A0A1C7LT18_GRIFR|nr:hypothetical protein A0H81_12947 [Grifola frondosa]